MRERTCQRTSTRVADPFVDGDENEDLLIIQFTDGDEAGNIAILEATRRLNMKVFDEINAKESRAIHNELRKDFTLFRKYINMSGEHRCNPFDFSETLCRQLTSINQIEEVYWYLFCTQTNSRADQFSSFYGLYDEELVCKADGKVGSSKGSGRKRKKDEDAKEDLIVKSMNDNTNMFRLVQEERNEIMRRSQESQSIASMQDSLRQTLRELREETDEESIEMLRMLAKHTSEELKKATSNT